MDYFAQPVFVVGLPRSGTSMIAGSIAACGAWTGQTVPGGDVNPKGFYESIYLREKVNKRILEAAGADPLGISPLPDLFNLPNVNGLRQTAYDLLEHEGYTRDRPWMFKEPKLTLIWPVFAQAFPHAYWVVVRREKKHIIDSCLRTPFMVQHGTDRVFWEDWADAYIARLELLKTTVTQCWEIQADNVAQGDYSDLEPLISWLGLRWNKAAVDQFVAPELWNSKLA